MKKSVLAILLAVLLVFFCGCSSETKERIPVPETPAGFEVYSDGPLYVYYPTDKGLEDAPSAGVDFQVVNGETGEGVNVVSEDKVFGTVEDLSDKDAEDIIDTVVKQLKNEYEEALALECDVECTRKKVEKKAFGNETCLAVSYDITVAVPDYDVSLTTSFYQVCYIDESSRTLYTVTYSYFPEDDSDNAEKYFADAIDLLFIA